ncbi:MAG: molybdopterin-guanine dinucleotide biosynthesis protein B [Bacillus sp. (in: firmicutes)]
MPNPCIIQIVGYKNSGKTHLICRLIKELRSYGYRIGTIKHDAHGFEIDHEGRDTWKHYQSGAEIVAITSSAKTALIRRNTVALHDLVKTMEGLDIILVEGFKTENYTKIVMLREEEDLELLPKIKDILLVAAWIPYNKNENMLIVDVSDTQKITKIVLEYYQTFRKN